MKTAEFLDLIERWGVMPPMQVANLRKQVASADYPVHPVLLARRLVEEGYINSYFAKTLLEGGPPTAGQDTAAAAPDDDYQLAPLSGGSRWEDEADEEDLSEFEFDDLELPPIEGADWLTRSVDMEAVGSLPSLAATTKLEADSASRSWADRWKEPGPAGLPWWLIGLAAVGALAIVILLLVLIF